MVLYYGFSVNIICTCSFNVYNVVCGYSEVTLNIHINGFFFFF